MSSKKLHSPTAPSHLKDLLLLFAIPIGIALFAAAIIYLPRLAARPATDFIYASCGDYSCADRYYVDSSGRVVEYPLGVKNDSFLNYYKSTENLRYYTAADDSTRSVSLDEAQSFQLNSSSKSPDGYTLARQSTDSGFLFWGDYDEGWYLKNGAKKKKVELSTGGNRYSSDVKFLGWVEK